MSFGRSKYRDQGVYGGSQSGFSNLQPRVGTGREQQQHGRDAERADDFSRGERRGSPVYDLYTGFLGQKKEKSSATYGSWDAGSQALKISTSSSASASNSKSEGLISPYGVYDMDDSSFFAHTTRLNLIGPNPNSTQFPRRRSSSTERLLINGGERSMATAASSLRKIDRSCSPPPVPENRTSPTKSYMQLSLQPSLPLADPTSSRKLLILDLNGTLLLRSSHSGRRAPPRVNKLSHHPYPPLPALRTVYTRPYLPSLRDYIFHPTTLQWLDTMVWSSAQPHSVNDMVDKCFGRDKEDLIAVWARDTFGLSSKDYHKKTQTIKDLAKPWAQSPSLIPDLNHTQYSPYQPEDPDFEVDEDRDYHPSVPPKQQQQHSALTTVLMDDSPLKAILQPWNHLCVPEYESARRKKDVCLVEWEMERKSLAEQEQTDVAMAEQEMVGRMRESDRISVEQEHARGLEEEGERNGLAKRIRKRKGKKLLKDEKLEVEEKFLAMEQLEVQGKEEKVEESYDALLLAVIGILDALKHEGNVAGWMRSGGLVNVVDVQETISETPETETPPTTMTMPIPIPNPQTTTSLASSLSLTPSKRDSSTISIQGPSKRRRLTHDTELDPVSASGERIMELDSDSEMVTTPTTTTTAQVGQAWTGVPLSTTAETAAAASSSSTIPTFGTSNKNSPTPLIEPQHGPPLWYESTWVLDYWAQRGRKALAELEIDVIHGVMSPNYRE